MYVKLKNKVQKDILTVNIDLPLSKSILNRLMTIDFLYGDHELIKKISLKKDVPEDVKIFLYSLEKLIEIKEKAEFYVGDAGTATRFLTAVLAITPGTWKIHGSARMNKRPMKELFDALQTVGVSIEFLDNKGCLPVIIHGKSIERFEGSIDASKSSQFVSALLLIAAKCEKGFSLEICNPVSISYIDITISLLNHFGISFQEQNGKYILESFDYKKTPFSLEKDWSSAAFWYALVSTQRVKDVFFRYLSIESLQGDKRIFDIMKMLGVETQQEEKGVRIKYNAMLNKQNEINLNLNAQPDLLPYVLVAFAIQKKKVLISGLGHLNYKESSRLDELVNQLNKNGFFIKKLSKERIQLLDKSSFPQSLMNFDAKNDHRLIMAFSLFALFCEVNIENASNVEKSYPKYWDDITRLIERSTS